MSVIKKWSEDRMNSPEVLPVIRRMCKSVSALRDSPILLETLTWIADATVSWRQLTDLSHVGALWREETHTWDDDGNYCYAILFWTLHYMVDRTTPLGIAMSAVQERYGSLNAVHAKPDSYNSMAFAGDVIECVLANSMVRQEWTIHSDNLIKGNAQKLLLAFCDDWLEFTNLMGEYLPYRHRPPPIEVVSVFCGNTIAVYFPNGGAIPTPAEAWLNGTMTAETVLTASDASRWLEDATLELQQNR
jgi:hypothetical protein